MTYDIAIDGKNYRLDLQQTDGSWSCRVDGREVEVDAVLARPNVLSLRIGNKAYEVKCERVGGDVHIWVGSRSALLLKSVIRVRCAGACSRRGRSRSKEINRSDARQDCSRSGASGR